MANLHLRKILGRYVFRRRIPTALIKRVGRKELVRGIGVCTHAEALRRARSLAVASDLFFEVIMADKTLTKTEIEALARRLYVDLVDEADRRHAHLDFGDPSELEAEIRSAKRAAEGSGVLLEINDWRTATELVGQITEMAGVSVPSGTDQHRELCRLALRAFHQANLQRVAKLDGNYGLSVTDNLFQDVKSEPSVAKGLVATSPPPTPSISLFALIDAHVKAMSKEWTAQTSNQNAVTFRFLKDLIGDVEVSKIGRRHLSEFDAALKALPSDYGQQPALKGKSLQEVLHLDAKRSTTINKLKQKTVNRHMSAVSGLFSWADKHGHWEGKNPAKGFVDKKRANETAGNRRVWRQNEIKALLDSSIWRGSNVERNAHFFIPLIGLFMGMSLEEICKLQALEIRELDGMWVIDVVVSDEGRVKEKARQRTLPIHPKLVEFGFLAHVDTIRKAGGLVLWPELTKGGIDKKRSANFSKWFGRLCRLLQLKPLGEADAKLDFHSFRHTVGDMLHKKGVAETTANDILGHAPDTISYGVYSRGPGLKPMYDALCLIDYEIDLSHLVYRPESVRV